MKSVFKLKTRYRFKSEQAKNEFLAKYTSYSSFCRDVGLGEFWFIRVLEWHDSLDDDEGKVCVFEFRTNDTDLRYSNADTAMHDTMIDYFIEVGQTSTEDGSIFTGQVYTHHKGNRYTVLHVANVASINDKYPPTVVYQGENGHVWTKTVTEFNRTMELS